MFLEFLARVGEVN